MLCATWWFQVPGRQPPLPESTRRLRWSHGQPSLMIHWWTLDIGHHFCAVQNLFRWLIIYFTPYFTTTCRCHRLGHGSIAVFQIGNQGWSSLPSEDSECCRLFPSFGFIITLRALFHPKLTPNFEMVADFVDEQYVGAILLLWHQTLSRIKFEQCHFWELAYRHIGL